MLSLLENKLVSMSLYTVSGIFIGWGLAFSFYDWVAHVLSISLGLASFLFLASYERIERLFEERINNEAPEVITQVAQAEEEPELFKCKNCNCYIVKNGDGWSHHKGEPCSCGCERPLSWDSHDTPPREGNVAPPQESDNEYSRCPNCTEDQYDGEVCGNCGYFKEG